MFSKSSKPRIMLISEIIAILLFSTLFIIGCENNSAPVHPEENNDPEKDGVITMQFWEKVNDENGYLKELVCIDSLDISETEHKIDIPNAVPFHLPKINGASIWFFGDFEGMTDRVAVWYEYIRTDLWGKQRRMIEIDVIGNNQGVTTLVALDRPDFGPVRGFVFALDHDNQNTGTGIIRITLESQVDTLVIDAAKNTVCYPENSAQLSFTLQDSLNGLKIFSEDNESFNLLKDEAIWIVEFEGALKSGIIAQSSNWGLGTTPFFTRHFTAYGFAPNFITEH